MDTREFLKSFNDDLFFTGVPDSQLKELCNYLMHTYGINDSHFICANEGNAAALAAGVYLSTGKVPVVYMQNSGIGNVINPLASLLNEKVYAIPCIFIVGWRGEPGVKDEPQHIYQGEVTLRLFEDMGVETFIIDKNTSIQEVKLKIDEYSSSLFHSGKSLAFIIKKGAFASDIKINYSNNYTMLREEIIEHIVKYSGDDVIVSTTGKASRELFEIREKNKQSHKYDFLTVGSMGHSSSIALGIAINKPNSKIWCIDGDGAALMHMGAMAVIGARKPKNLVHIIINNEAHETVGGMPTVASSVDFIAVAKGCGYPNCISVDSFDNLDLALSKAKEKDELSLIEVKASMGARDDLGRPTTTAKQNKENFMNYLKELN